MKKITRLSFSKAVVIALLCVLSNTSFASHIVGLYLTYTYQGPNTYLLHLKLYRDCSGINAPLNPQVCFNSVSTGGSGVAVLNTISSAQVPLNSCAAQGTTWCNGGTYYGIEEYNYEGVATLTNAASDWVFSYAECCRNGAITTLATNYGAYVETTLDNLTYPINSSPQFNSTLFGLYCIGTLTNISYQCTDADGDSLVFRLDSLYDGSTCPTPGMSPISYLPPYGYLNPISSFTPFTLNQSTGILSFTPAMIQIGAVSFIVDEYRNGVKIGSVKRDDQLVIVGENPDPAVVKGNVYLDGNGNNIKDAGEPGIPNQVITETTTSIYVLTDANGDYSMNLVPGSFDLTTTAPPHFTVTPGMIPVNILTAPSLSTGNDFALAPDMSFTDLTMSITQCTPPRPGAMPASYVMSVVNNGTQINNGTVTLTFDTLLTYDSSTFAGGIVNGNTVTWTFSNLIPLTQLTFTVFFTTSITSQGGEILTLDAEVTPNFGDKTQADNEAVTHPVIVLSYDPNYKAVAPVGDVSTSFITNGEYLDYEIHFQNTGLGDALYVKINDGLDANLDISTLEFVSSSHPCTMKLSSVGLLTFEFNNIVLSSMFTDELHSTGFARFRIKPKSTLTAGDEVLNGAGIIFDNNAPVITQTVITRIVNVTGIFTPQDSQNSIALYPNPVKDYLNVINNSKESFTLNVYDVTGRSVLSQAANQQKIKVTKLNSGIYSYEVIQKQNKVTIGKFVKE